MVTARRANTILYTDRWPEMVAFYRDALALPIEFENDWFVEFSIGPAVYVSVADASRTSIGAGDGAGLTLSLQVDDVAAVHEELQRTGVEIGAVGTRWGADTVDVRDPAGNRLEFWSSRPPSVPSPDR